MRLWTLYPQYLDPQGLVALWREALLARAVLRGETRGYRHHPQLHRCEAQSSPRPAINTYLRCVLTEAQARGYAFDASKIGPIRQSMRISATTGQLACEWQHLLRKLQVCRSALYQRWVSMDMPEAHPLFKITRGPVAAWERAPGVFAG